MEIVMVWAKRRFKWAEYARYQDLIGDLQLKDATRFRDYLMFSVDTEKSGEAEIYISLPDTVMLALFDGFEAVPETDLPKDVDGLLLGDVTAFDARFKFKHNRRR